MPAFLNVLNKQMMYTCLRPLLNGIQNQCNEYTRVWLHSTYKINNPKYTYYTTLVVFIRYMMAAHSLGNFRVVVIPNNVLRSFTASEVDFQVQTTM